ncbi:sigma-54 dependent transcriptional regulator [Elizabethkingia meningoseptica]|uniref:Sigma-54-dependent Fis family transcriptional regulator n=1 Tax=Elizabethkingia meningoseptica TaxID=238 RepID=A0A1T3INP6_ELIME|nr:MULTISPECIES: sigma-54 dependent transcriptional regulator [Elizabethkingia]AQX12795.1 sigma-54-dependent Fis family transcriptional regulator [Elizabethkingia meningoseptica]EJK5329757.1 sigma-54-dependent Fis family transcriptional regulator [Elizabethkingia meningoseptica]MBG0514313.1 sigma-54-dependent Fis family transcriptional regulator [Elizabethkingia meningoseptica]MDE5433229.1 sigma-54 dependent transcriptional regulator [Elizabethkingia meningoseptica]MDE5438827.1 sigma-54 depend
MRKKTAKILIVDDDEDILFSAKVWLKKFFTDVKTLNNPKKILPALTEETFDVVLLDMNFRKGFENGQDGLHWMNEIKEIAPEIPIILMTAYGEVELAVEALKLGAVDFILKPWNNEKLYASVNLAVDISRKNKKINQWESIQQHDQNYILESNSGTVQEVLHTIEKIAPTDANVLLLGENGTGKYVLAEQVHRKSPRSKEPFVHIDLGSLPEGLFEAELFGYKKGAFTDAIADTAGKIENAQGGTVFLDEIGNLPLHLQAKLLTLIQNKKLSRIGETKERQMDVRFIFATNENLQQKVNEFLFRKDLYFRINTVEITIPPLRERLEDLTLFTQYFLDKYQYKYHKTLSLSEKNIQELQQYYWPGNIRELEHTIERSVILSDHGLLQLSLPKPMEDNLQEIPDVLNIEEMEEILIKKALKKHQGNISLAAEDLGLSRAALYRRMEKFGI